MSFAAQPSSLAGQRFLLGTVAHNQHVQNLALAFYQSRLLAEYHTGGVDVWKSSWGRQAREFVGRLYPALNAKIARRQISTIPQILVTTDWRWEGCRLAGKYLGFGPMLEDWIWERSEYAIDDYCTRKIDRDECDVFMGVEFGALRALGRAKELGKAGIVAFLSPHHATRERWVDWEYERFPELLSRETKILLDKGRLRDARRDQEARTADVIHCASRFTRDSLVAAGLPLKKIIVAPLGCPLVSTATSAPAPGPVRFLYSGPASIRKGAHLLLDAWKKVRPSKAAELHFFGVVALPHRCLENLGGNVFFHGPVGSARIAEEYRSSSVLVFPTLCDGFGMVVAEAFANGLPVITTPNAGAADLVRENENGWLVTPGDVEALAARLEWCIDHSESLKDLREPARETARQWTWAHFRGRFLDQLHEKLAPIVESTSA